MADRAGLAAVKDLYQIVNVKLDKTGGLTEALALARDARALGLQVMVGCMAGTSLAMAPGMVVGQLAEFVDLDGPLLHAKDREHGIEYDRGLMQLPFDCSVGMKNANRRSLSLAALLSASLLCAAPPAEAARSTGAAAPARGAAQPFDVIIANGHIVDGTGSPWYSGMSASETGISRPSASWRSAPAKQRIDAAGKVVAPGFIDMLGQSEFTILVDPRLPSKIYQGITTEITGEGTSAAPMTGFARTEAAQTLEHYGLKADWQSLGEYFARLERQGIGINLASYVGATTLREVVIGGENRPPTAAELERMRALVREAMDDGAVGVSTSLEYAPAPYASTEELIALAAEAAPYGGIYATHMRSEGDGMVAALDETFRIAREAHIPAEIWHLKVAGKKNWGHMPEVIKRIEAARAAGLDITADTYAYTAWFNDMSAFVPPWAHDGGNEKMVERLKDPATPRAHRQGHQDPERGLGQRMGRGPGARLHSHRRGQEPRAASPARPDHRGHRQGARQGPARDPAGYFGRGQWLHGLRGVRHAGGRCRAGAGAALGLGEQRQFRHLARGNTGPGASASARLWDLPPNPAQVRARGASPVAGGGDPQVHRAAGAAPAA